MISLNDYSQFWSALTCLEISRYRFMCSDILALVKATSNLMSIIKSNIDEEEVEEIVRMRSFLLRMILTPVAFNEEFFESLSFLQNKRYIMSVWGKEAASIAETINNIRHHFIFKGNPLRSLLAEILSDLYEKKINFRIFCPRPDRVKFTEILPLLERSDINYFIHSSHDFALEDLFDVLVTVGPFQAKGWQRTPDAVFTVPKTPKILNFIWDNVFDDKDIGFDPVQKISGSSLPKIQIIEIPIRVESLQPTLPLNDEQATNLLSLIPKSSSSLVENLVLLQISKLKGYLVSQVSEVLTLDLQDNDQMLAKRQAKTLVAGETFIILPDITAFDIGKVENRKGKYSEIWKAELKSRMDRDFPSLVGMLDAAGLKRKDLTGALERWIKKASNVIHAPKRLTDFKRLLQALELNNNDESWTMEAWREIVYSRAQAIQDGMVSQELIDFELSEKLGKILPKILSQVKNDQFTVSIPDESLVKGWLNFYRIQSIDFNLIGPEKSVGSFVNIQDVVQWQK